MVLVSFNVENIKVCHSILNNFVQEHLMWTLRDKSLLIPNDNIGKVYLLQGNYYIDEHIIKLNFSLYLRKRRGLSLDVYIFFLLQLQIGIRAKYL